MGRIFLSHSSVDNAKAIGLARWLEREGWDDPFLDLHPHRGIASGERWEKALFHYAVVVRILDETELETLAFPLRLHRATLARNLEPQLFAKEWRRAMATVASIRP